MGGYGSGRRHLPTRKQAAERLQQLDIRRLHRDGALRPGAIAQYAWTRQSEVEANAAIIVSRESILLVPLEDGEPSDTGTEIPLVQTPCHYGSQRDWFLCPQPACGRRVAVLYLQRDRWACRVCHGLTYATRQAGAEDRLIWRAKKLRAKAGGSGSLVEEFPERPKFMKRSKYECLKAEGERLTEEAMAAIGESIRADLRFVTRVEEGLTRDS